MKKKATTIIAIISIAISSWAQIEVKSTITGATVFLKGAQIEREATVNLKQGNNVFVFSDLPQTLNSKTISVESETSLTLLSVKHNLNYLKNIEKPKEVVKMEDSLKHLNQTLSYKNTILQVYREEESMILSNKSVAGQENGVQADNLKNTSDFFRTRLLDIKTKQYEIYIEIEQLKENIQRITNHISEKLNSKKGPVSEVYITVNSKKAISSKIKISYFVPEASWTPIYDIRANELDKPVQMILKANIFNWSGENWENVNLILSTSNPLIGNSKPKINKWHLQPHYDDDGIILISDGEILESSVSVLDKKTEIQAMEYSYSPTNEFEKSVFNQATIENNMTTIQYIIETPYSIPSDGKDYAVEIQEILMDAEFQYQSIPKIDKDAFLIARINGWEKHNFLPGFANIFSEGKYIGETYINPNIINDTLEVSLGRDKSITVLRELLVDFSSEKILGSNKTVDKTYEISVRNRKKLPITILIEDHIPVSTSSDIKVEFDQKKSSNAQYDEESGKLKWLLTINPNATVKLRFEFSVKHPKNMNLVIK